MAKRASMKKQNRALYWMIRALLRPYLKLLYNYSVPRDLPKLPDGPILMLGTHSSNLDFLFALSALKKKRFNTVVTSYYFNNVRIGRLLRFFHCIEKEQFRADVAAIRDMRAAIKNGASVLIYPEGEVNGTGRCEAPDRNITRLCRMLDVPVYCVRTCGSYFTRPKWGPVARRGKVTAEVEKIADAAELKTLAEGELYERICQKLSHNDYDWQRTAMVPFRYRAAAEGLHQLLYKCPRCGAEYSTRTKGDEIYCTECGNRGYMDEFGFLHARGENDVIFETVPEWVDMQRASIEREFSNEGFRLSAKATLQFHTRTDSVKHDDVGEGTVSLDREALVYEGGCNGEKVTLYYPLTSFVKLPFSMGLQFDVPNPLRYTSIKPHNPQAVEKFVLAVPVIKRMNQQRNAAGEDKGKQTVTRMTDGAD